MREKTRKLIIAGVVASIALAIIPTPWRLLPLLGGVLVSPILLLLGLIRPLWVKDETRWQVIYTYGGIFLYCFFGFGVAALPPAPPQVAIEPSPTPMEIIQTPSPSPSVAPIPSPEPSISTEPTPSPERTIAGTTPIREGTTGEGCECPYDRDKRGRRCGARSAYEKAEGAKPICYVGE